MFYLAISKRTYYLSLDLADARYKARRIGAGKNILTCLSLDQAKDLIDLFLRSIYARDYCALPLVVNRPTDFIRGNEYLYYDRQINCCWIFEEIPCASTVLFDAKEFCRYPNHTSFDSFDAEMQKALDDCGKVMFYDFEKRILYYIEEDSCWYTISTGDGILHEPEKLSRKPKLSNPKYIVDGHFITPMTES